MPLAFTTAARVLARLGAIAVELRTDYSPDALDEAIETASADIEWYCWQYLPTALAESRWVQTKATDLACYYLATLQFNPASGSIAEVYQHTIEQLKEVQAGRAVVPGAPLGRNGKPGVVNYRVELDRFPSVRVEQPRTTGPRPEGYRIKNDTTSDRATR